jgi:hypothetical protein
LVENAKVSATPAICAEAGPLRAGDRASLTLPVFTSPRVAKPRHRDSYAVVGAARGATRTANNPHERIVGGTGQYLQIRPDDNLHMV